MAKMKAGTLIPQIHQMKKELQEKKDSMSAEERRTLIHRMKRTQRKARRIQGDEDRRAAAAAKAKAKVQAEAASEEKKSTDADEKKEASSETTDAAQEADTSDEDSPAT